MTPAKAWGRGKKAAKTRGSEGGGAPRRRRTGRGAEAEAPPAPGLPRLAPPPPIAPRSSPAPRASGGGHRMFFRSGPPTPAPALTFPPLPSPTPAAGTLFNSFPSALRSAQRALAGEGVPPFPPTPRTGSSIQGGMGRRAPAQRWGSVLRIHWPVAGGRGRDEERS